MDSAVQTYDVQGSNVCVYMFVYMFKSFLAGGLIAYIQFSKEFMIQEYLGGSP